VLAKLEHDVVGSNLERRVVRVFSLNLIQEPFPALVVFWRVAERRNHIESFVGSHGLASEIRSAGQPSWSIRTFLVMALASLGWSKDGNFLLNCTMGGITEECEGSRRFFVSDPRSIEEVSFSLDDREVLTAVRGSILGNTCEI